MLQRTNIYLEPETIMYYKQQAKLKGTSMAEELREVVKANIKKPQKSWAESTQHMIDTAGKGPKDLSTNLDQYLYGNKK